MKLLRMRPWLVVVGLCGVMMGLGAAVQAQQIYRIVGPDGRVSYSDKPPAEPGAKAGLANTAGNSAGDSSSSALPFELRQVASKFPVTLYTGPNCGPCSAGKAMLAVRGIPFTERTVSTSDDIETLQRLAGDSSLPLVTIGGQQLKGFSESEWNQFLDAAGYPKTSALPPAYRPPAATPLVALQRPPAAPAEVARAAPGGRPPAPAVSTSPAPSPAQDNPAGIRF